METPDSKVKIKWTPRISKEKLKHLYDQDVTGLYDEDLIEDIGILLYMRCKDILAVKAAREGNVRCPECIAKDIETYIKRPEKRSKELENEKLICQKCGFAFTWKDFMKSFKRNQLNAGGAVTAFSSYIERYERAKDIHEKVIVIDRLIHEFHYSNKKNPDLPTRSVGPNLINGKLSDIMRFLDELSNGDYGTELHKSSVKWRENAKIWADTWATWLEDNK